MSSIDDIEKLLTVASKAVADLHRAIEAHVGFGAHATWISHQGKVFCYPAGDAEPCNNLSQSMADMVAEVAAYDPMMRDKARLREIERERARLVAKLEAAK